MYSDHYQPQQSCGQGYVFTRVCDSVHRGGVLSQHALQVVSQHALQQVSRGGCYPSMHCRWYPSMPCSRSLGGACSQGGCGLLLWSSGMAFWFGGLLIEGGLLVESGLLLWPSDVIFCYGLLVLGGVSPNRDPFQQEGHTRMAFWYGLLAMPCMPPATHAPPPPADGYCCGRYASYWNAFLFCFCFYISCIMIF